MTTMPRPRLAYHLTDGAGPTVVFLPGYASDMNGTKALHLEAWAKAAGRRFLRFDYGGCGQSEGDFADQTLNGWRDDVLAMLDELAGERAVLVGSSMGGWLMLLAARARPAQVAAMVGIAAAPDFTDWGFSTDEKMAMLQTGRLERANPYGPEPTIYTKGFWQSGEANRLLAGPIAFDGPVRLLHGMADRDVPWHHSTRLAELLGSADVQVTVVKDGDHRLSREADLALLVRTLEELLPTS
jgi:pimeloyl-ACP methyl ester carboxylesterase